MEASRAGTGEFLAGAGGLLLWLAMFLPWFGVDASFTLPGQSEPVTVADRSLNAWESFGLVDVLLAATAALALSLPAVPSRFKRVLGLAAIAGAALCALAIVYRLLDPPSLLLVDTPETASQAASRVGAFFGLLSTAVIAGGARWASAPYEVPARRVQGHLERWSRADIEARCARPWRNYDRRLDTHYRRYFERHPELRGDKPLSARDLGAALPPGWEELSDAMPVRRWERQHLSAKSSQTLAVALLGQAARKDPSLSWLFSALWVGAPLAPRLEFAHSVPSELLGERPRRTTVDVLVEDASAVVCIATKWREPGIAGCSCRGAGAGPLEARCSPRVESRAPYWAAARDAFGLPSRRRSYRCPISPMYELVRTAAAARALAGPDRLALLALIYDAANPYFRPSGDWPGWPALLREAVEPNADPAEFRFAALSWQELLPQLPVDEATRAWARDKHRLGGPRPVASARAPGPQDLPAEASRRAIDVAGGVPGTDAEDVPARLALERLR